MSASTAVTQAIDGEFSGIATQNGLIVQGIIDDASNTAQDLQDYLENSYVKYDQMLAKQAVDEEGNKIPFPTKKSMVYDVEIKELNYEVENYILSSAWSVVKNNPDIIGVGAFFEPYAYDAVIENYTLYVGQEDAKNRTAQSYGAYSEYSKNDYYQQAATTLRPCFTKPYVDQGVTMITSSFPIVSKGKLQGVIVVDINVDNFSKVKSKDEKYPTMYTNILTEDSTIVYDSESNEFVGQKLSEMLDSEQYSRINEKIQTAAVFDVRTAKSDGTNVARYYYPVTAGDAIWWSATALAETDLNKSVNSLSVLMIIMAVAALAAIVIVTGLLLRKMLKPIDGVVDAALQIAKGNLDINVEVKSEDEIGILSQTFMGMSNNLKSIISDINYLLGEMADGNFQVATTIEDRYVGEYGNILKALKNINVNLSSTLAQINQASDQVASGSDQVSSGAQALSQGATEQASSIEELSATIAEISSHIKANANNAQVANTLADEAGAGVIESNQHMREMVTAMGEITNTSNEIGKIIKTIDDIAFQTNILALNAAVEAARAGAAGKGFAVVADEVRNLSQKSAEAAQNTTALIENAITAIANGTKIADQTAKSLQMVVEKSNMVQEKIGEIAIASDGQATSVVQVTQGVEQISSVVQTNSATSEESAAASEELSGQAQMLKTLVGRFKLRDDSNFTNNGFDPAPQTKEVAITALSDASSKY
ncbi:MAG: methyl-accepting chemotaxis protein [Angelakisella sp.]